MKYYCNYYYITITYYYNLNLQSHNLHDDFIVVSYL